MAEDIKKKDIALAEAEKKKVQLKSSEKEVAELRQRITKLKLEHTKNSQLASRLQNEKEESERKRGVWPENEATQFGRKGGRREKRSKRQFRK